MAMHWLIVLNFLAPTRYILAGVVTHVSDKLTQTS